MLKLNEFLIRISCLLPIFIFSTVALGENHGKDSISPVLVECEINEEIDTPPIATEELKLPYSFRGNKVFGFDKKGDLTRAREDAENICKREDCEILSCKEVEGDISDNFAIKCDLAYVLDGVYEYVDRQREMELRDFPSVFFMLHFIRRNFQSELILVWFEI